jgi:flotillin
VIYGGRYAGTEGFRVITGRGLFLRPILDSYKVLSLEPVQVVVEWDLLTKDGREVRVEVLCNVAAGREKEMLERAAQHVLGKDAEGIRLLAKNVLDGQARTLAVGFTFNQIKFDREAFAAALQEKASGALASQGLAVRDLQVNEVGEPFHREEILDRIRKLTERMDALEKGVKKR